MQKIMFNDFYGLTQASIDGNKTHIRMPITLSIYKEGSHEGLQQVYYEDVILHEGIWHFKYKGKLYRMPKQNCPRYKVGEVVAVAQSYKNAGFRSDEIFYRSNPKIDGYIKETAGSQKGWNNKMFVAPNLMPHQIRITNIRAERLQDISDEDCLAEGIIKGRVGSEDTHFMDAYYIPNKMLEPYCSPRRAYSVLIDKISGKGTWESNPFVWVYEYELVK